MRDYDPTTGRYIQADPLGLIDGPSVYGYALQNPGRYVDPRGEFAFVIPVIGGIIGGGGTASTLTGGAGIVGVGAGILLVGSATPVGTQGAEGPIGLDINGNLTKSTTVDQPKKKRGQWTCNCRAQCNDNIPENCPDKNGLTFAHGSASNQNFSIAKRTAQDNAEHQLSCQGKHTTCKCTGPKGDKFRD